MRKQFFAISLLLLIATAALAAFWPMALWAYAVWLPLLGLGFYDAAQTKHAIRRNFPLIGRGRYLMERLRPEIQQYFIESNASGRPFNRIERSIVYQRSKQALSTQPFGTQLDVYAPGYEWVNHSLAPKHVHLETMRVMIGGPSCKKPYAASLLNISAMSYGSLSKNAVLALNTGARKGGFAHNTGEGGLTPYHLGPGGDVIWELGTAYFGCRKADGTFDPEAFAEKANHPNVKMIEIKLSQGAKPGHGGILPAQKLTAEIAGIRGVPMGQDVVSPSAHTAFSTPIGLLEFVERLRQLSGGKPVGFKFCLGKRREFLAICKAMVRTKLCPDYIVVDGGEGGTGAAPLEFTDHVGTPLNEAMVFVHNALVGIGVRDKVKLLVAGRVVTGFDIVTKIAMGADACYSARGMMMALGCIQALQCNANTCPTGVATQDPSLTHGLVVTDKSERVANFHKATLESAGELIGAMGLDSAAKLKPWHIMRRTGPFEIKHYGELFEYLEEGSLLRPSVPRSFARAWDAATPESFEAKSADVNELRA